MRGAPAGDTYTHNLGERKWAWRRQYLYVSINIVGKLVRGEKSENFSDKLWIYIKKQKEMSAMIITNKITNQFKDTDNITREKVINQKLARIIINLQKPASRF